MKEPSIDTLYLSKENTGSRGGKREGAGRKPLPVSDRLQQVTIWLTPEQIAFAKENSPSGEVSEHVRSLVERDLRRVSF